MAVPELVAARRSVRLFLQDPIAREQIDSWIEAACLAPAPHHSRPWRFVVLDTHPGKESLARGMGARWREDLTRDGLGESQIAALLAKSHGTITSAPALVLACLTDAGLDHYPDEPRRRAEHGMALLSLGAAVENLMLAAAADGYATCWMAAPIFCPEAARDSLALPDGWLPHALVLAGRADPRYAARSRLAVPLGEMRDFR